MKKTMGKKQEMQAMRRGSRAACRSVLAASGPAMPEL